MDYESSEHAHWATTTSAEAQLWPFLSLKLNCNQPLAGGFTCRKCSHILPACGPTTFEPLSFLPCPSEAAYRLQPPIRLSIHSPASVSQGSIRISFACGLAYIWRDIGAQTSPDTGARWRCCQDHPRSSASHPTPRRWSCCTCRDSNHCASVIKASHIAQQRLQALAVAASVAVDAQQQDAWPAGSGGEVAGARYAQVTDASDVVGFAAPCCAGWCRANAWLGR